MAPPSMNRWTNAVHYRWRCEGDCGQDGAWVAVIRRRGKPDIRLCRDCYADGWWRNPTRQREGVNA